MFCVFVIYHRFHSQSPFVPTDEKKEKKSLATRAEFHFHNFSSLDLAEICPEQLRDQNCNMHCALIVLYSVVAVCLQLFFFTRKVTFKRIISSRVFTFWNQTLFSIVFIYSVTSRSYLVMPATGLAKYSFWAFWLDFPKIHFNFLKSFLCQSVNIYWIYSKYSYM